MPRLNFTKRPALLLAVILLQALAGRSFGQDAHWEELSGTPYSANEMNSLLAKSINNNRIVMIGDSYHAHHSYSDALAGFLESWIDSASANPIFEPRKIALILEMDSISSAYLNEYFLSGNIVKYAEYHAQGIWEYGGWNMFSVDSYRLFSQLKKVKDRINLLRSSPVDLIITGFDNGYKKEPGQDLEKWMDEKFIWFVHERDKNLAAKTKALLEKLPDYKGLFYYGSAHLRRELMDKSFASDMKKNYENTKDYFLAHYLDEIYGRDSVCIFNAGGAPDKRYERIIKYKQTELSPDYVYQIKPQPLFPFPIYFLTTKGSLNLYINSSKKYFNEGKELYLHFLNAAYSLLQRSYMIYDDKYSDKLKTLEAMLPGCGKDTSVFLKALGNLSTLASGFDDIRNLREMDKWIISQGASDVNVYGMALKSIIYNILYYDKTLYDSREYAAIYSDAGQTALTEKDRILAAQMIDKIKVYTAINYMSLPSLINAEDIAALINEPENKETRDLWKSLLAEYSKE